LAGDVTKLNRFPRAGEQLAEPEEFLEPFDETNQALNDTVRHLRALSPTRTHGPEILAFLQGTIHDQNVEIGKLRTELAKVVETVNVKASKRALEKYAADVNGRIDKRLDGIRNWTAIAITATGLIFAAAKLAGK
jgi:hypothetical protein